MAMALDRLPASTARRPGMLSISSTVARVASGWSEQRSTSASSSWEMSPSSRAGRWCRAAETMAPGTASWTQAAIEPRGGMRGTNSWPTRTRALAIDTTTLPASSSATDAAVGAAASQGVATTTRSAEAASTLSPPRILSSCLGQRSTRSRQMSQARSLDREPTTTSSPLAARRTAKPCPAGPVPPRTPMLTQPPLHFATGLDDTRRRRSTGGGPW